MLFRRKKRPPLREAMSLVDEAIRVIYAHWHDTRYSPSAEDVRAFDELQKSLSNAHATARRIAIRMQRRLHG